MFRVIFVTLFAVATMALPCHAGGPDALASQGSVAAPLRAPIARFSLPPMGWSSWNSFSNTVNSEVIQRQGRALVSTGLKDLGYRFVNIDEGWWLGKRDEHGGIVVDPAQWPALKPGQRTGDMSNIVEYLHGLGLQAGIYTDAGEAGCGFYGPDLGSPMPHTGSEGHYEEDFLQFASWGFDYVKVDWCGGSKENLDPAVQYQQIAHAIQKAEQRSGHALYFSICNWGNNSPWTWAPGIGGIASDIWRTSGDIVAPIVAGTPNGSRKATLEGVLTNFDQGIHIQAQHTGYYNDLDMMLIGMPGLSAAQNRLHMSLWAISGAPLILGLDLTKVDDLTRAVLANKEVIAIDQDPLGLQCMKVAEAEPGLQVWVKPLAGPGERAVLLMNRTKSPAAIGFLLKQIGLAPSSPASIRDVWEGADIGIHSVKFESVVAPGDAKMLRVSGVEASGLNVDTTGFKNEAFSDEVDVQGAEKPIHRGAAGDSGTVLAVTVRHFEGPALVRVSYINTTGTLLTADMAVNGQHPNTIAFPPTGSAEKQQSLAFEIEGGAVAEKATLKFVCAGRLKPTIESVFLQPYIIP